MGGSSDGISDGYVEGYPLGESLVSYGGAEVGYSNRIPGVDYFGKYECSELGDSLGS